MKIVVLSAVVINCIIFYQCAASGRQNVVGLFIPHPARISWNFSHQTFRYYGAIIVGFEPVRNDCYYVQHQLTFAQFAIAVSEEARSFS